MPSRSSDGATDFGRMDSERQIREKPTTRWLDDVVQQAEKESDEANEMIKQGKREMDEKYAAFIPALDKALAHTDGAKSEERHRQARILLTKSDNLLKLYRRADETIAMAFGDLNGLESIQKNHLADVDRMKDILGAGKRLTAGDVEEVKNRESKEVVEQAKGIFGAAENDVAHSMDIEESIVSVERGVKRLVRDLE